ncbi:MAG TPA: hypothetical protein VGG57_06995 [Stellaceae bacterium]
MTLDDFLTWEDGTDTRYELVAGTEIPLAELYDGLVFDDQLAG